MMGSSDEAIRLSGNFGRVTGSHLHFGFTILEYTVNTLDFVNKINAIFWRTRLKKKSLLQYILYLFMALFFAGCLSKYPMGLSKEQWLQLSQQEQLKLTKQQQMLDHEIALKREKQRELALEIELKKQQRIDALYQNATIGDTIVLNFESGYAINSKQKLPIIPQGVILARGETKEIDLQLQRGRQIRTQRVYLHYRNDGTQVEIALSPLNQRINKIVLLNSGKWRYGTKYQNQKLEVSKYRGLSRLNLSIRYHEATLKDRERYIIIPR